MFTGLVIHFFFLLLFYSKIEKSTRKDDGLFYNHYFQYMLQQKQIS
jgi:hypothetical protein